MLASVTVTNASDVFNGDTSSIASLIANDGGDGIALREAILAGNNDAGADTILFDAGLDGATISLVAGEMAIFEAVTIDASGLTSGLTIDAQRNSRIFNITATTGDFAIAGLTITGGRTRLEDASGGAIRSLTDGNLTIDQSTISGNSTWGDYAKGGGIYAGGGPFTRGDVTLINSTVSGNSTAGESAYGGGISANHNVTLTNSTVSGNSTAGESAYGGGIYAGDNVTLTDSTVNGNRTSGSSADGGGIFAWGDVTLTNRDRKSVV